MKHSPWTAWLFLGLLAAAAIVCCCHRCFALICSSTTTTTTTASRSSSRTVKHSNYHYLSSIKATNGIDTTRPYVTSKFKFFPLQLSDSNNNDSNSMLQEAKRLREKARKLKEDVQARQTEKDLQTQQTKIDLERTQEEKRERESRYSAKLPILKSDGSTQLETVYFTPRFPSVRGVCENINIYYHIVIDNIMHSQIPSHCIFSNFDIVFFQILKCSHSKSRACPK